MAEDNGDQAHAQAVSLKLPTFWTEQPDVWFAQAEAQFNVRNVTADDTKYHYAVAALDQSTAKRVLDLLSAPPANDKYESLKTRLTDTFGLSEFERGSRLLHQPDIGDEKPSHLMDDMLALLGKHPPCFLFRSLFLERLPEEIRSVLVHSKEEDCRQLAKAADALWEARQHSTHAVRRVSARTSKPPSAPPDKQPSSGICFYHSKFGDRAQHCRQPCTYAS